MSQLGDCSMSQVAVLIIAHWLCLPLREQMKAGLHFSLPYMLVVVCEWMVVGLICGCVE